jgi:hypothetical protein
MMRQKTHLISSMRARYKEILYLIGNTATIQKIQPILIGR